MFENMKLGKKPAKKDPRTLRLGKYMADLPAPPASVTNSRNITDWGMFLNDTLGCCTISGVGHAIQVMVVSNILPASPSGIIHPSDDIILRYYEQWDGYNPADPSTDQGGVEIDVLNNWRQQGLRGFAGYQLLAYADPAPTNITHVKQAISLFGGVYIGVGMPDGWQSASVWDTNMGDPNSWGGHAVFIPDYDAIGPTCITWGMLQKMTWAGFQQYVDEVHALIVPDWVPPVGFDLAALQGDLSSVTA